MLPNNSRTMFRNVFNCDSTHFTLIHSFYFLDYKFTNSVIIYLSRLDSPCIAGLIPDFLELPITYTGHLYGKLSHYKPGQGSSNLRFPEFPDNQHVKMARLSAPCIASLAPRRYPWYSILSRLQVHSVAGRINSMKNPLTPLGIEATTLWLGAHSLTRLHRTY